MSSQQQPKGSSAFSSPQVIAAIIGGFVTLIVAVLGFLPNLINPPPAATAMLVVIATTQASPVEASTITPSVTMAITATNSPMATEAEVSTTPVSPTEALPTPVPTLPANLLLMWDDVAFTAINLDGKRLSLLGVSFSSTGGSWDAYSWGPSVYNSLPAHDCLRLRDAASGQRNPPAECGGLYGLILVGPTALFWRGVDSFDVYQHGQVIESCLVAAGRCEIHAAQ